MIKHVLDIFIAIRKLIQNLFKVTVLKFQSGHHFCECIKMRLLFVFKKDCFVVNNVSLWVKTTCFTIFDYTGDDKENFFLTHRTDYFFIHSKSLSIKPIQKISVEIFMSILQEWYMINMMLKNSFTEPILQSFGKELKQFLNFIIMIKLWIALRLRKVIINLEISILI